MKCFRDGNQMVVVLDDFVDLQQSPAVFFPVDSQDGRALEQHGVGGLPFGVFRETFLELKAEQAYRRMTAEGEEESDENVV